MLGRQQGLERSQGATQHQEADEPVGTSQRPLDMTGCGWSYCGPKVHGDRLSWQVCVVWEESTYLRLDWEMVTRYTTADASTGGW